MIEYCSHFYAGIWVRVSVKSFLYLNLTQNQITTKFNILINFPNTTFQWTIHSSITLNYIESITQCQSTARNWRQGSEFKSKLDDFYLSLKPTHSYSSFKSTWFLHIPRFKSLIHSITISIFLDLVTQCQSTAVVDWQGSEFKSQRGHFCPKIKIFPPNTYQPISTWFLHTPRVKSFIHNITISIFLDLVTQC